MPSLSTNNAYLLDRMNSTAFKSLLGTILKALCDLPAPVAHGQHTTVGGAAAEDITISGVVATDVVQVVLHTAGAAPVTVDSVVADVGKITVTFSADPSSDHVVNYSVFKAS